MNICIFVDKNQASVVPSCMSMLRDTRANAYPTESRMKGDEISSLRVRSHLKSTCPSGWTHQPIISVGARKNQHLNRTNFLPTSIGFLCVYVSGHFVIDTKEEGSTIPYIVLFFLFFFARSSLRLISVPCYLGSPLYVIVPYFYWFYQTLTTCIWSFVKLSFNCLAFSIIKRDILAEVRSQR